MACSQSVVFSHPTGYYENSFLLTLSPSSTLEDGWTIRYTLNGFDPSPHSRVYCDPIYLDTACYSDFKLYNVRNCPPGQWNPPQSVDHIIVVRAALFDALGQRKSSIQTASFFIQDLNDKEVTLPILSLCADSVALLSQDSGIFIPGVFFDPDDDQWTGNYYQSGKDWERKAHVDYFSPSADRLSMYCGIRTHGGNSRRLMQKGFTLYAREEYGKKNFGYAFFPDNSLTKYKRLCIRPVSASWSDACIQDWLSHIMARDLRFDNLAARPVTLYINGEYWGIYILQEKPDEHYVDNHYGYDDDHVIVIGNWFGLVENGSNGSFRRLMTFVKESDLSIDENYQSLCNMIDVPAFIDYQLFEMFIGNYDWPMNNMRCWQYGDSPWRWIYYDGDASMKSVGSMDNIFCEDEGNGWPSNAQSTLLFRSLLNNRDFSQRTYLQMSKLLGLLDAETLSYLIDSTQTALAEEIPYQIARFGFPISVTSWDSAISNIRTYFTLAPNAMWQKLRDRLNLDPDVFQNLNVYPNPIKEDFTAYFVANQAGPIEAAVFDVMGRLLMKEDLTVQEGVNEFHFHLGLPNGVYLIRIGNLSAKLHVRN